MLLGEWVSASVDLITVLVLAGAPVVSIGAYVVYKTLSPHRPKPN